MDAFSSKNLQIIDKGAAYLFAKAAHGRLEAVSRSMGKCVTSARSAGEPVATIDVLLSIREKVEASILELDAVIRRFEGQGGN